MNSISKILSSNDLGTTGTHQAGVHIPKTNESILQFFPALYKSQKNPSKIIEFLRRDNSTKITLRFIYYNSAFFGGTRNEYRLTGLTSYLREVGAAVGDQLIMSDESGKYYIEVKSLKSPSQKLSIKLSGSWSSNGK